MPRPHLALLVSLFILLAAGIYTLTSPKGKHENIYLLKILPSAVNRVQDPSAASNTQPTSASAFDPAATQQPLSAASFSGSQFNADYDSISILQEQSPQTRWNPFSHLALSVTGYLNASNSAAVYQNVPGQFAVIDVRRRADKEGPRTGHKEVVPQFSHSIGADGKYSESNTCQRQAAKIPEPFTVLYTPRATLPPILPTSVPLAYYQWPGNISEAQFRSIPSSLGGSGCVHCSKVLKYKVIGGNLYRSERSPHWSSKPAEDMMLVAIHLFKLPNMDLALHFGDGCPDNVPVIGWNVCRKHTFGGFTMPSYTAWCNSMGHKQARAYQQCLLERYPSSSRDHQVKWRGSTTDTQVSFLTLSNWDKTARVKLHQMMQRANTAKLDIRLTEVVHGANDGRFLHLLTGLGARLPFEDNNKAAIILDMDGNGWSDRFVKLAHFPTPILKQSSNYTAFFEHLIAPGHMVEHFQNDLSDSEHRALTILQEWEKDPSRLNLQRERLQALARGLLGHVGLAEAMAYTMRLYSSKSTWEVKPEHGYFAIPWSHACTENGMLPRELCADMHQRGTPPPLRRRKR